jgi:3-methyladenine DNA glycosylase AlkD
MSRTIEDIRKDLISNADEKTKKSGEKFFKEPVVMYGVKSAIVSRISREHYKNLPEKHKPEVFDLCEKLWQSGLMEESFIACNWSWFIRKEFEPTDFELFAVWIDSYVNNWASCDTFCNHTVGTLIEMFPDQITGLKEWARSKNRWMRRASAVSLIVPARKGKFLKEIIELADILLTDSDDMVQKGYGWMLKVASQLHQNEVFDYVMRKKTLMPRTALRYAIEKMPGELKTKAMAK